jgi:hypothetical protein
VSEQDPAEITELDLSDVDHRVGQPVGGGQLWDPCSSSDIRRWVMAMDYPNPCCSGRSTPRRLSS